MLHICVGELGHHWFRKWLVAFRRQVITWNNIALLSIRPLAINFNEIWINMQKLLSFTKMHLKISSVKWRPFSTGGDELSNKSNANITLFRMNSIYGCLERSCINGWLAPLLWNGTKFKIKIIHNRKPLYTEAYWRPIASLNSPPPLVLHICVNGLGHPWSNILIQENAYKTLSMKWWSFCPGGDELTWSLLLHILAFCHHVIRKMHSKTSSVE